MIEFKIELKSSEKSFEITNEYGEFGLIIDEVHKTISVDPPNRNHFMFLDSDPERVMRVGKLIAEAGRVAKGQIISNGQVQS